MTLACSCDFPLERSVSWRPSSVCVFRTFLLHQQDPSGVAGTRTASCAESECLTASFLGAKERVCFQHRTHALNCTQGAPAKDLVTSPPLKTEAHLFSQMRVGQGWRRRCGRIRLLLKQRFQLILLIFSTLSLHPPLLEECGIPTSDHCRDSAL